MEKLVSRILIENEVDVMLAHKRAKQLAEITGLSFADQAKFSAAVSEISRNAVEHAHSGTIDFTIAENSNKFLIRAHVHDTGKGIENIDEALKRIPDKKGKGVGLSSAKKLVDFFEIQSVCGAGTSIKIGMHIPPTHPPINESIIQGWKEFFENENVLSPYEMLKKQNFLLIDTLEQLKIKNLMIENQLDEIKRLNSELEVNNTEILRLSKEHKDQNTLLKKKNDELDEFAYIVSHDLKAPLNNMLGMINILESETPDKKDDLSILKGQVSRMIEMIVDILSYARSGNENVERSEVDTHSLVEEIIKTLEVPGNIKINIDSNLPVITTEKIYLQQVFSNLIGNAIKYNDKETGKISISYSHSNDDTYQFTVADNGPGIPDHKKEEVFNMYSVIRGNKSIESTGLGLAIVKKIVQSRGGTIKAEDNTNGGTKFIFSWPEEPIHSPKNKVKEIA